ncbi:MAG: metallophosphoesterase [Spirosomataceae bacterium]
MNKLLIIPLLTLIFLLIDWYVFQAVKVAFQNTSSSTQQWVKWIYWGLNLLILSGMWLYNFGNPDWFGKNVRTFLLVGVFISYFSKLFVLVFLLIDDLIRLGRWIVSLFTKPEVNALATAPSPTETTISRSEFLMKTALVVGAVPLGAATWGILSGAHDYRVRRVTLRLKDLPKSFDGFRIAQISDIHSGSFFNKTAVKGGVEMILKEKADVIFFTGDLVNNRANEVEEYIPIFNKLKAPLGVYSTLGNHDYGDYYNWASKQAKQQNLNDVKHAHKLLGWDLLNDEHRILTESGEQLAILGVQNCGFGRFQRQNYGNLAKAYAGTDEAPVKLLLSHDPQHWDGEVNTNYKDINVMFSGHTHGTQFGVNIGDLHWSPAQYAYKQWAGLYQQEDQYLYVNRGYGYIGFPGRVGMPPEITVFELKSV